MGLRRLCARALMCEVKMIETAKKEMIYLAAYGVIKRMLENGVISKEAFDRLNIRMAAEQACKPIAA